MSGYRKFATPADRFWAFVTPTDGCWEFSGYRNPDGYGKVSNPDGRGGGVPLLAHRVSWEIHNGPIADGMQVLHRCDNPPCCNPDHLWLGTVQDNARDRQLKGRSRTVTQPGVPRTVWPDEVVQSARSMRAEFGLSARRIALTLGVPQTTMRKWLRGQYR